MVLIWSQTKTILVDHLGKGVDDMSAHERVDVFGGEVYWFRTVHGPIGMVTYQLRFGGFCKTEAS